MGFDLYRNCADSFVCFNFSIAKMTIILVVAFIIILGGSMMLFLLSGQKESFGILGGKCAVSPRGGGRGKK